MTSIRPSMPGVQQTGPMQNVQRAQPQAKTEEAKAPPPPPKEVSSTPKDENKSRTFDDTPMQDVSIKFEGEAKATEATAEIEGLFEPEAEGEVEETSEAEEAEAPEGEGEVEEAGEAEAAEVEEAEEEEEEGDAGEFEDSEGGGAEAELLVNVAPLLEIVPQLRQLARFRVEETWQAYGG